MVELNVSKLATVKKYDAGKEGKMLVFLVDKLAPVTVMNGKGKDVDIQVLICTANVKDPAFVNKLEDLVDFNTPCDKVILVSKKFMKLSNKVQRALLEIENEKVKATADTNMDAVIYGEIAAIEKFGKLVAFRAIKKSDKVRHVNEKKASKGLYRQYKKDCRALKKLEKAGIRDDDDFEDEDFFEVPVEPAANDAKESSSEETKAPEDSGNKAPNQKGAKFNQKNPAPANA